jgi:hypothetical protein
MLKTTNLEILRIFAVVSGTFNVTGKAVLQLPQYGGLNRLYGP